MPRSPLAIQARTFAEDLNALLNGTVTDGPRLSCLIADDNNTATISFGGNRRRAMSQLIPMGVSGPTRVWLSLFYSVALDRDRDFLEITQSAMTLFSEDRRADDALIVSIDFARDPGNKYPGAHLHVGGNRSDLDRIYGGDERKVRKLRDLHFPVGGKRFRPTLEDLVEFMVLEEMAVPRNGWESMVQKHRELWMERQARAAVRNHQDAAAEVLRSKGWTVEPPQS